MKKPVIGFAGMTHLGINSAVATAERGFDVICYDNDTHPINELKQGKLSIQEPDLLEYLQKNQSRMQFSDELNDLCSCDVVYIAKDVPTDEQGKSDLSGITALIEVVSQVLHAQAILVILCQVPPGFTRKLSFPKDRLYYQVETLVFGQAVVRALHPERFIVGCATPRHALLPPYQTVLAAFNCAILPMRYESAELAKISINCCLVSSVSVANTLSEICEKMGADWSEIVPALKLDKRIGQFAYLAPGLGLAGGNLERDLTTVLEMSKEHGTEADTVSSWIKNSQYRRDWVLKKLHEVVLSKKLDPLIGVLGLAYKENTHSIKNSPSLALLQSLSAYRIKAYDPAVPPLELKGVERVSTALEVVSGADVLIIMTPWAEFKTLAPVILKNLMSGNLIVDPYRVLADLDLAQHGFYYLTLGVSELCSSI